ncbi:nucleotide exchange factor SIL1 isoform X1 [Microcebus murinus]|uniref:Nucleotide exchange factor SIL1 n=1 Tax=Microcebus murinus TaxID=30608 RepID=A0A8B7F8J0_MICMU|nr:nucleotide exchange factor SIL1 [Microcebus murinus]XP_012604258.1 nucleotide exchange factor SIL1 [Microcebus murinus]XP_012604259.1 nucleotide exchange factor SIL1 [Microcebus murinus]XP_012604260.1 nucleotide exchange factor SIL1 [Microcebus murinus]XP_012604261.1 nucleotide exchange factor SIL1 [Microcebus murinus]XP_012604262.1 nucleotide exchange factor SIL1 [Microcebus murinus]
MAPQSRPPSRMAPLGMLLGLLMAFCFTFCLSRQNEKEFALTNPEKSSTKETERTETKAEEELDTEVLEVFHPTHEWQALGPGQAVPAGSHVRLNLQTGAKEVKLQYEDKFRNNLKGLKKGKRLDVNTNTYTSQDLKDALAKFKEGAEMESSKEDKARQAEVKRLFRPIEELKKDFDELNVVIETDMQIMVRLINKFNSSSSSLEEKIAALFDLEYYVHQMDNAQDLLSFGGLQVVINGLNSTEPAVKEYAAFVLGAAFSSNPRVQVEAVEGGALQKLLVILATEQPLAVKKKVLFALCSLLRHFPYAQQQFLKLGGLQVLRSLVQEKGTDVLAVRVVTLLYDLVTEKMFAEEEAELTQDTSPEKLQQYRRVHLLPGLREQGWCAITAHLLALPGHDAREKVLHTLGALLATCRDHYRQDPSLGRTLASLQAEYQALASAELQDGEDEGYFRDLLGSVESLLRELR